MIHRTGEELGGRYRLVAFLGEGGMQEVYRAHDTVLEREVAIKVPKNASATRRFQQSAAFSARINHPNVAKTLDFFDQGERFYLAEELIIGEDLSKARRRLAVMDPYLVAHILHHLAKGVAASHTVGVVHRDLKPSNIMVSPNLTFKAVKITDFGIAKMSQDEIVEAVAGGNETITNSSTVAGAIPYLSPEMIDTPRSASSPTDIWALGAIAFELLTGTKPYGKGLAAIPKILAAAQPALPNSATSNSQFADTAKAVFGIILACLNKDPAARPTAFSLVQTCEALCYPMHPRVVGTVSSIRMGGRFAEVEGGGTVFFHSASVFGQSPRVRDEVLLSPHYGKPYPRSHPVLLLTRPEREVGEPA